MKKKILHSDRWPEPKGPYSAALTLDHLSGFIIPGIFTPLASSSSMSLSSFRQPSMPRWCWAAWP